MTKRLLAIALVVMVAVSAMYLPSVLNVSAADTTKTADKAGYEALLKTYTVTVNGYNRQTVKLHPSDVTSPEAMLKALAASDIYLPANSGIVAVEPITGETDAYNVKTATKGNVVVQADVAGVTLKLIKTIKDVVEGSLVTDLTKDLATPAPVLNKVFLGWDTEGVDKNFDGKVDAFGIIKPSYGLVEGGTTLNFYTMKDTPATTATEYDAFIKALTNAGYVTVDADGKLVVTNAEKNTTNPTKVYNLGDVASLFAVNPTAPSEGEGTADPTTTIKVIEKSVLAVKDDTTRPVATYVFSHWVETKTDVNARNFVAVYKKEVTKAYTYTFLKEDSAKTPFNMTVQSDSILNGTAAYDLLTDAQKATITEYLGTDKAVKSWTVLTTGDAKILNVVLSVDTLKPITYYYIDETGAVNKTVVKTNTAVNSPLDYTIATAKDLKFVKWNLVPGTDNTYNGTYDVADVIYPEAKKGNDSFAFSSTATPKTAKYKKTMVARVTAGKGTFNKAEVKLVNKTVKLSANAINCTVKKGTMKETSGTPYTITFNKKGTAYVVVSIAYNGSVYTKTLTKTVK